MLDWLRGFRPNGSCPDGVGDALLADESASANGVGDGLTPDKSGSSQDRPLSSVVRTFGNIVISVVGAGVLGLPYTFKQSGWLAGFLTLLIVAVACYYTMMLLVYCKRKVESQGHVETYSDLGLVIYGKYGQWAVDLLIVLSQGGFCVGYLIFIGKNLATIFGNATLVNGAAESVADELLRVFPLDRGWGTISGSIGAAWSGWSSKAVYIWIALVFQLMLACVRSLTRLAPFSIFADVANFSAMAFVLGIDAVVLARQGIGNVGSFTNVASLPVVIGVAIYAFEGFGLVLPLESNMKDRSKFGVTLAVAMASIATMYITFAVLGYMAFGDTVKDIITLNLGDSWQSSIVKIALCTGLFFTFPVMMHPVHEVLERRILGKDSYLLRFAIVILAAVMAVSVPRFTDFLSLVGNSVCGILAFVMPAMFHLRLFNNQMHWYTRVIDYALIVLGLFFCVWGTISSIGDLTQ